MSYQVITGLNSVTDLLTAIKTFADGEGYSTTLTSISGGQNLAFTLAGTTVNYSTVTASDGGQYTPALYVNFTGFSSASVRGIPETGMAIFFFSVFDEYIHLVIKRGTNFYSHLWAGALDKRGLSYTGGLYVASTPLRDIYLFGTSCSGMAFDNRQESYIVSTCVTANIDSRGLVSFITPSGNSGTNPPNKLHCGFASSQSFDNSIFTSSPSTYNGQASLLRLNARAYNSAGTILRSLGSPKDVRSINISSLSPEDVITLGADSWVIFPAITKNGTTTTWPTSTNSGSYGYAFKKIL